MSRGGVIVIAGCVSDPLFHQCLKLAKMLQDAGTAVHVDGGEMYETQFDDYLCKAKRKLGGNIFEHNANHVILLDGGRKYLGAFKELLSLAASTVPFFGYQEDDEIDWVRVANEECEKTLRCSGHSLVYMDVALTPSSRPQRVVFRLFDDICPTTCENFRVLCTGEKGTSSNGTKLTYKGSPFHRVVKDGWVQGGDIVSGAGDEGISIYGDTFGDEAFTVSMNEIGVLAMANDGPHTNASQFLVTLAPQPWLDHQVVGFGRLPHKGLK